MFYCGRCKISTERSFIKTRNLSTSSNKTGCHGSLHDSCLGNIIITKERNSLTKLNDYVQSKFIEKGKVVKMNHIVEMYKNLVEQSGGEETGFKVQNVKERLQSHFWDKLCFFSPKSQTN